MPVRSRFVILVVLLFSHSALSNWLSDATPVNGYSQITSLTLPRISGLVRDMFGICFTSSAPNQRQLCRTSNFLSLLSGEKTINSTSFALISTVNNFAAVALGTDRPNAHLTGGLTTPVAYSGVATSSFQYSLNQADGELTFASQYFGTVVASAFDRLFVHSDNVLVQYHLAYYVEQSSNSFRWLVQRVVSGRPELNTAWTINDYIATSCSAYMTPDNIRAVVTPILEGTILSVVVSGSSSCAGVFQFNVPATSLNSTAFSLRNTSLFTIDAMALDEDSLYFASKSSLCRVNLRDLQQSCHSNSNIYLRVSHIVLSAERVYVAYHMRYIEEFGFDLLSRTRYLPLDVAIDSMTILNSALFATFRTTSNGQIVAMMAGTSLRAMLSWEELTAPTMTVVPVTYGAEVVLGLAISLAVAGILAIIGWALCIAARKRANAFVKNDSYLMLNEKLNK